MKHTLYKLYMESIVAKSKNGVNKAAEIRKYFAANPNAKGIEVVEALAKRGIKVAPAQVSNVKVAANKKGKRKKVAAASRSTGGADGVGVKEVLDAAFTMLDRMSVEDATDLLERLAGGRRKAK